eukprot:7522379-Karenia_brevis.AAC.1
MVGYAPKFFFSIISMCCLAVMARPELLVHLLLGLLKFLPQYIVYAVERMFDQVVMELTPELGPP